MNLEGGGCSEPRLHHCTPAWTTEQDPVSKKKKKIVDNMAFTGYFTMARQTDRNIDRYIEAY